MLWWEQEEWLQDDKSCVDEVEIAAAVTLDWKKMFLLSLFFS